MIEQALTAVAEFLNAVHAVEQLARFVTMPFTVIGLIVDHLEYLGLL